MRRAVGVIFLLLFLAPTALAQSLDPAQELRPFPDDEFFVARVEAVEPAGEEEVLGAIRKLQRVTLTITRGERAGETIEIVEEDRFAAAPESDDRVQAGQVVVLRQMTLASGELFYSIDDRYRLAALGWIFLIFFALAIIFGRLKGLTSIAGLVVSFVILIGYIIPQLLSGANPIAVTLIGSVLIALVAMFLAHGFNRRTAVALVSTLVTLFLATLLADWFVDAAHLLGFGSEEAFYLQVGEGQALNFQGLLLGGIIIGMLGVLDDVTTTQSAAVEEIKKAKPDVSRRELYTRGLSIGREHIASLVNTLVLAYAGASLPLFLLFATAQAQPLWVTLNSELIGEEVVRTLAGSSALILAVPISTLLAAYYFSKKSPSA